LESRLLERVPAISIRLVLRQNVKERDGHWKEWLAKSPALLATPAAQQILAQAKLIHATRRSHFMCMTALL
jgi:hypothetical protein